MTGLCADMRAAGRWPGLWAREQLLRLGLQGRASGVVGLAPGRGRGQKGSNGGVGGIGGSAWTKGRASDYPALTTLPAALPARPCGALWS